MTLKQCKSCGALVKVIKECPENCMQCCGKEMETVVPNSVDAAVEKHIPTYEILGDTISVYVPHVMEEEHFIEWISLVSDSKEYTVKLSPNEEPKAIFPYISNSTLYSYCNKHGLWKTTVN